MTETSGRFSPFSHVLSLAEGKTTNGLSGPEKGELPGLSRSVTPLCCMRGAYAQYVSTEKWRECRWRHFSTEPTFSFSRLADSRKASLPSPP